jgi:hypothetical protein
MTRGLERGERKWEMRKDRYIYRFHCTRKIEVELRWYIGQNCTVLWFFIRRFRSSRFGSGASVYDELRSIRVRDD